MTKSFVFVQSVCILLLIFANAATAEYRDLMGFPQLQDSLGDNIPTGLDIEVAHIEAKDNSNNYMPNTSDPDFSGKTIINSSGSSSDFSSHAGAVAHNYYGNDYSIAPGVNQILVFEATDWLGNGMLKSTSSTSPNTSSARIANHSYITDYGSYSGSTLRRTDFLVEEDDFIQIIAVPNSYNENFPIYKNAYNIISVGITAGTHKTGTSQTDSVYSDGRTSPTIVATGTIYNGSGEYTSYAAPMVSAGTALLLDTALNPDLSNGTITNRVRTINHAETSEVIKASLMAGADRYVDNAHGSDLTGYTINTSNNLDNTYGAGQINIFNSYQIIAGSEQDSMEDGGIGNVSAFGFDYDPLFSHDDLATYAFTATAGHETLTASLVWNIDIGNGPPGPIFDSTAALYDLNLTLYDVTSNTTLVMESGSTNENTENIWTNLTLGHDYQLQVTGNGDPFEWDYGLAWQIISDPFTIIADYSGNGQLEYTDISLLYDAVLASIPPSQTQFDLNKDGDIDQQDVDQLVRGILNCQYGDANLDRMINAADLTNLLSHYGHITDWHEGDFNGDRIVNAPDLVRLLANYGFQPSENEPAIITATVATPEPTSLTILLCFTAGSIMTRKRR